MKDFYDVSSYSKLMKKVFISLIISFVFLVFTKVSSAAIYYVSTTGSDSNTGTDLAPWRTVSKAAEMLNAGDTVYIKDGTYIEQVIPARSGFAGNEITYAAFPGHTPVLDGETLSTANRDWGGLFWIKDKSYINVRGLRIQNSASISGTPGIAGILVTNSSSINLENNAILNTRSSGIAVWDSTYVWILANDIQKAVNGGSQECITVSNSSNFEIAQNHVHNGSQLEVGGEGIAVKQDSAFGVVHHNDVFDLSGEVGIYIDAYNSPAPGTHHIKVYDNSVYTVGLGIAISAEQGGNVQDIQVFNNIVHQNQSHGIMVTDWMSPNEGTKKNIDIFNNTVVANGSGTYGGGLLIASTLIENIFVDNNILSDNRDWQLAVNIGAESLVFATNNLLYGWNSYNDGRIISVTGTNTVVGMNPLFVGEIDFHLTPGSPCVDAGSNSGVPSTLTTDFEGNARIIDGNHDGILTVDMGAYEFNAADERLYTFITDPPGLQIGVDGDTYVTPYTFTWNPGSHHPVSVVSPQNETSGSRFVYASWSDGGGQSHTITAPLSNENYTANFDVEYNLTTSVNPAGTGIVNPPDTHWYLSGQDVSVSATANAGYVFTRWSGSLTDTANPILISMNISRTLTANFANTNNSLSVVKTGTGTGTVTSNPRG